VLKTFEVFHPETLFLKILLTAKLAHYRVRGRAAKRGIAYETYYCRLT